MQRGRRGKERGEDKMSNVKVLTHGVFRLEGEKIKKMIEKRNKKGTKN